MAAEGLKLKAKANVKITKLDENNQVIGYTEHEVELSDEEVEELWRLQQQE